MSKQKKSGTEKRRAKKYDPGRVQRAGSEALVRAALTESGKNRESARLLLRALGWVVANPDKVSGGEVKIPLAELRRDVDVGMFVDHEANTLVIVPAPPAPPFCACTRQETSFEPNRGGHIVGCPAWGTAHENTHALNVASMFDLLSLVIDGMPRLEDPASVRVQHAIMGWDPSGYMEALMWAEQEHLAASDNNVKRLPTPAVIAALAHTMENIRQEGAPT